MLTCPCRTVTNTYTTITTTTTNTVQITPTTTAVVTAAKAKRNLAKGRFQVGAVSRFIDAVEASGTASGADPTFVSALSSACSCFGPAQTTLTSTYTDSPTVSRDHFLWSVPTSDYLYRLAPSVCT